VKSIIEKHLYTVETVLSYQMLSNDDNNTPCKVLWSTQSGRAKACARRVVRILKEQYQVQILTQSTFDNASLMLQSSTSNISAIEGDSISSTPMIWIMMVSTTGDGEHCDSIHSTWKQL
jgi:sulfite reductase alpha subunit-like flavoprotein